MKPTGANVAISQNTRPRTTPRAYLLSPAMRGGGVWGSVRVETVTGGTSRPLPLAGGEELEVAIETLEVLGVSGLEPQVGADREIDDGARN